MIKHNKNFSTTPYIYPMYGETFGPGVVENEIFSGNLVRFKAIGNTTFNNIGKDQLEKELNKGLVNNFYYIIDNEELYKDNIINGKYNFDQMLLCLTKNELYIFRNTIFAYYGYIFQSQKLKKMFSQYDWYRPEFNNNTCMDRINKYNKLILEEIQKYEKK